MTNQPAFRYAGRQRHAGRGPTERTCVQPVLGLLQTMNGVDCIYIGSSSGLIF